jgi:Sulfotransferase family
MAETTQPIFIVSSGRSGTAMMERLFAVFPQIDMHHEYMVHHVQPAACGYQMGILDEERTLDVLRLTHLAAVHYSTAPFWGDASNKLSWLIPLLDRLFPTARYVHLVRDGRKVASSYFHKLAAECYDDASTAVLQAFYDAQGTLPAPPPEKKYWWPLPHHDDPLAETFRGYDQFERIVHHWAEINHVILRDLENIPWERKLTIRLEDLVTHGQERQRLLNFLHLPWDDRIAALLARPHNVNRPEDYPLKPKQIEQFWRIAGGIMRELGYSERPEYRVAYRG